MVLKLWGRSLPGQAHVLPSVGEAKWGCSRGTRCQGRWCGEKAAGKGPGLPRGAVFPNTNLPPRPRVQKSWGLADWAPARPGSLSAPGWFGPGPFHHLQRFYLFFFPFPTLSHSAFSSIRAGRLSVLFDFVSPPQSLAPCLKHSRSRDHY